MKMETTFPPIIQASELLQLYTSASIIIIDARSGKEAKSNYESKHLEGALFLDLDKDLAEVNNDPSIGGRHPLPKIEDFAKTLSTIGLSKKSHVVIYDDKNGSNAAARLWWMLKSIGHEKVQVLNGGIQEAEKVNFPMSSKSEVIKKTEGYEFYDWKFPLADLDEVEKVAQMENCTVIDVRDADRYHGKVEPIDLIAGHIPGAINIPYSENLSENGLFLSPSDLKDKYEDIFKKTESKNIIVHCGSGVTACHTLLAMAYAGLEIPKLYVGSWSEWSRNDKPIATLNLRK